MVSDEDYSLRVKLFLKQMFIITHEKLLSRLWTTTHNKNIYICNLYWT